MVFKSANKLMCLDMSVAKTCHIKKVSCEKTHIWRWGWVVSYHINDHFAKRLTLLFVQVAEYVAVRVLQQFKSHCQVMVFQNWFVVIHESQFGTLSVKRNQWINATRTIQVSSFFIKKIMIVPFQSLDIKVLTCIDEKLIGEARMVHVMNSGCEDGSHDFQIGKDRLFWEEDKNDKKTSIKYCMTCFLTCAINGVLSNI